MTLLNSVKFRNKKKSDRALLCTRKEDRAMQYWLRSLNTDNSLLLDLLCIKENDYCLSKTQYDPHLSDMFEGRWCVSEAWCVIRYN